MEDMFDARRHRSSRHRTIGIVAALIGLCVTLLPSPASALGYRQFTYAGCTVSGTSYSFGAETAKLNGCSTASKVAVRGYACNVNNICVWTAWSVVSGTRTVWQWAPAGLEFRSAQHRVYAPNGSFQMFTT